MVLRKVAEGELLNDFPNAIHTNMGTDYMYRIQDFRFVHVPSVVILSAVLRCLCLVLPSVASSHVISECRSMAPRVLTTDACIKNPWAKEAQHHPAEAMVAL